MKNESLEVEDQRSGCKGQSIPRDLAYQALEKIIEGILFDEISPGLRRLYFEAKAQRDAKDAMSASNQILEGKAMPPDPSMDFTELHLMQDIFHSRWGDAGGTLNFLAQCPPALEVLGRVAKKGLWKVPGSDLAQIHADATALRDAKEALKAIDAMLDEN